MQGNCVPRLNFDKPSLFSGMHSALFFKIVETIASLAEVEDYNINQIDYRSRTPFLWAAWGWHEGVVKIFPGWVTPTPTI